MFYQGIVPHENMGSIKVGDCIIEFVREEIEKTFLDLQYQYRCNIIFKDLTGREIRRLVINEGQAMQLLDGINAYIYDDFNEAYLLSNIQGPTLFETYTVTMITQFHNGNPEDTRLQMIIQRYNGVLEVLEPVLTVTFTLDDLDKFVDTAFFIFLIDLASEREGIFKNG